MRRGWFDFPRAQAPAPTLREGLAALAGGFALAVVMFWPLVLHLGSDVPKDAVDPVLQAWILEWNGHALLHQPLEWWQANAFWPLPNSLAFSDPLIGLAPLALVGDGFAAALWHYNTAFLLAYALCFAGAYLLARELGIRPAAAVVAGVAFAYSPWRWEQSGHINVLSSGGIPLSLMLLLHGYRRSRPAAALTGWLVAAWQILVSVSIGLQLAYLLALLALVAFAVWWRAARPRPDRGLVRATVVGVLVFASVGVMVSSAYLQVRADHPESERILEVIELFSPPPRAFISASADNPIWGDATAGARSELRSQAEQTLFPGALTVALAGLGLVAATWSRRLRVGLAVALALCVVFSMGVEFVDDGRFTYRLLYDHMPGWDGTRTPGRLHTLSTLVLALLAAAGAHAISGEVVSRGRGRAAVALCAALAAVVLAEGSAVRIEDGRVEGARIVSVAQPPAGLRGVGGPILHLPASHPNFLRRDELSAWYMLWSVDGFPPIANGYSGFLPFRTARIADDAEGFPDARSVRALRDEDIRSVVLHPELAEGTVWQDAERRPIRGLGIRRERRGAIVIFDLGGYVDTAGSPGG